jgi:hypothetical protein
MPIDIVASAEPILVELVADEFHCRNFDSEVVLPRRNLRAKAAVQSVGATNGAADPSTPISARWWAAPRPSQTEKTPKLNSKVRTLK